MNLLLNMVALAC